MSPKVQAVLCKKSRYKVLEGGRGGGKSTPVADVLVARSSREKLRILCTREMQNSIRDSVHRLLSDRINALELAPFFHIKQDSITSLCGSEFIFKGLHHNISEIKSMEGVDICWIEEAEKVSKDSLDVLIPTIRKEGSEIWITFNPEDEKSPVYQRFVVSNPPDCLHAHVTWRDNKMFPEVLRREMEYDKRVDPEKYEHVWEGKVKKYSQDVIFRDKVVVEEFEAPEGVTFKFGADFGFSDDPTCLLRHYIQDNILYIDYEFYGHGVELTDLHKGFHSVPESYKWKIVADSQRPDTISFLSKDFRDRDGVIWRGFNIVGADKGKGSVEDGIEFLRGFEKIVIHPRCKGCKSDYGNYRWKKDKITDEILPIPLDKNNHGPDSSRYATEDYRKANNPRIRWL